MMTIFKETSVRFAEREEYIFKEQKEPGFLGLSKTGKEAIEKMKAHAKNEYHILSCEAKKAAARALQDESIIQQLQQIREQEKMENRMAINPLIRCTHSIARRHNPHIIKF